MPRKVIVSLVAAGLSLLLSLLSASQLIGHMARLVDVVGLFGGGAGSGAGIVAAMMNTRRSLPAPLSEPALSPVPHPGSPQDE